jgi:hypothetical protein
MEAGDGLPEALEVDAQPTSLEQALLEAAAELPGLVVRNARDRLEFLVGTHVVTTLDGAAAAYRLDPAVAAAALRTPDTRRSTSAVDWIVFEPRALDRYAADRAVAWLRSAVRRAGSGVNRSGRRSPA